MPEYIYEIEENQSDESEIFIGWIRTHSERLIRCKDCVYFSGDGFYCEYDLLVQSHDYCSMGKRIE